MEIELPFQAFKSLFILVKKIFRFYNI